MTGVAAFLLVRAATAASVTGLLACGAGWLLQGRQGLFGALLGAAVTLVFFSLSLLAMDASRRLQPQMVMAVAVLTYGTKVGVLMVMLVALFEATWLSGMAFALSVIACSAVWLAAQVLALRGARMPVYDEPPMA